MAYAAVDAPSTHPATRQIARAARWRTRVEAWLEAERDQLGLWLPVAFGAGIALWFVLPGPAEWLAAGLGALAVAAFALAIGRGGRASAALAVGALALGAGIGLAHARADRVAAPVLARPLMAEVTAWVEGIEPLPARELIRLTFNPLADAALPHRIRINLAEADVPAGIGRGAIVRMRARLVPPPAAAVPGAYDYARVAWFAGIGATGRGLAPVTLVSGGEVGGGLRARLTGHITDRVAGSAGGIAAALVTGDTGAIGETDAEAMRAAGLAHLLSVSGLHITAVVGATMFVVLRLLALFPWLALRWRLPVVAAALGAVAAIGYTLLTGAEVPTIRSCVAALLVLAALALGREAMTLRLVATGALIVLLLWPEALAGPSFQLSFAAITAIVAFHEHPRIRRFAEQRQERGWRRWGRALALLLATGVVVEGALMPIAVYHFHRAGLYGAAANIVAIPLTTFLIMPLEVVALLFDAVGLGAPFWWLAAQALALLLWLARTVAASPGAVTARAAMPDGAFALMILGGLWIALWRTWVRRWGVVPLAVGVAWAWLTPPPDLLVTGDGRHAAIRAEDGGVLLLRERTGDYMREVMAANGGTLAPGSMDAAREVRCSRDMCIATVRGWRVGMTRSAYHLPIDQMVAVCRSVDIMVSERRLPRTCAPRWLRLDRETLARTGGVAITLASGRIVTVRRPGDRHPWIDPPRVR